MAEWKDIATAPKREFNVILLGRVGKNHTLPCFWDGAKWQVATIFGQGQTYRDPTHWQPLPEPPK